MLRNSIVIIATLSLLAIGGAPRLADTDAMARWCPDSSSRGDSASFAKQAMKALYDSAGGGDELTVDDFQVIRSRSISLGVIVSLVPKNPRTIGGGGLVWVDAETFCPIVLRQYE